jgi:hypothetical protein
MQIYKSILPLAFKKDVKSQFNLFSCSRAKNHGYINRSKLKEPYLDSRRIAAEQKVLSFIAPLAKASRFYVVMLQLANRVGR